MGAELRYDGRVAIITGAGNGLGRSHALTLARRGAKVVVNDLGGSAFGDGKSTNAADKVVEEIKAFGGDAVANYDSVEDGDKIVKTAIDAFGRVDILINNAGILRDTSFQKMSQSDWDLIYKVHVLGSFKVTHAVWNIMREAGYGRIVFTSSAAGIYGNFGQANYSMAKLGLVGMSNTLALEGKKKNIVVNAIAPIAGSRMTETVLPKELLDALRPEFVSPLVAYLCHESNTDTGGLYEVGGGVITKLRWERTQGKSFKLARPLSIENVADGWSEISDFTHATHPSDITGSMEPIIANLGSAKSRGGNEFIDVDEALGAELPETSSSYDERDLALYALGIGAAADPLDDRDLQLVYELHGDGFKALPTYGVIPALRSMMEQAKQGVQAPGLKYGFEKVLHGEQYTELRRPLPSHAKLTHRMKIKDIFDKGKNAVVVTAMTSYDESGAEIVYNELTTVVRGAGGWGGERGPADPGNTPPDRAPDATVTEKTHPNQALLYRLSGDWNPLHADPGFAAAFGFQKPILHGLCTFGFAARHVINAFSKGDPRYFKSIKVRFADSVFPGETLITEMWKESSTRILFRTKVAERDKVVISNAAIELFAEIPSEKPTAKSAPAATAPAAAPVAAAPATAPAASPATGELSAPVLFAAIKHHIASHPELAKATQTTFLFNITDPNGSWLLDLKSEGGAVVEGSKGPADCTLEMTAADFLAMSTGKADPQKLYFGGKLKITGNVMASQKLGKVLKGVDASAVSAALGAAAAPASVDAKAAAAAVPESKAAAPAAKTSQAPALFEGIVKRLGASGTWGEVKSLVQFKLTGPDSAWVLDLREGASAREGTDPNASATLVLSEDDLAAWVAGSNNAKTLFMHGKLKVAGDVSAAQRLSVLRA